MTGSPAAGQLVGGYLLGTPDERAPLRLFCFHHAGGAASAFSSWGSALGPGVGVVPVQLPGREQRVREPRILDMAELTEELDEQLDGELRRPYAFYGHSLGALVALRLAQRRTARGANPPLALLVGAAGAPGLPSAAAAVAEAPDEQLAQWMTDIGGMSPILRSYPEWLARAIALTRDDLRLYAGDRAVRHGLRGPSGSRAPYERPVDCPIHVFLGDADPLVPAGHAAGWARCTSAECRVHTLPGGHFFIRDSWSAFLDRLLPVLRSTGPSPSFVI